LNIADENAQKQMFLNNLVSDLEKPSYKLISIASGQTVVNKGHLSKTD